MIAQKLTSSEILERRKKFFIEYEKDFPHIGDFVVTNSGVVEPKPQTQDEWENFHENLQFVDGTERGA